MPFASQTTSPSKSGLWTGRIVTAIPVLFLAFDSVIKLMKMDPVVQSFVQLGYPVDLARTIGFIELACLALYVFPRTSVLGAVLLTGYLGGGIATHVRVESPVFSHVLFPIYVAILIWGGLFLLDERLRAFVSLSISRPAVRH
jgi:hypothetical protein